jgi:hypothetical protein
MPAADRRRRSTTARWLLLAALGAGLAACDAPRSADELAAEAVPDPFTAYEGLWRGTDAAGGEYWFVVDRGEVRWLDLVVDVPAACVADPADAGPRPRRIVPLVAPFILDGATELLFERAGLIPDATSSANLKLRISGAVATGELIAQAEGDADRPGCAWRSSARFTAARATQQQIEDSQLSRADLVQGGIAAGRAHASDGLWRGRTAAGEHLEMLVLDNQLRWLETSHEMPAACEQAGGAMVLRAEFGVERRLRTRVRGGRFEVAEPFAQAGARAARLVLQGALAADAGSGRLEFHATPADPATLHGFAPCAFDLATEWSAQRVPLAEAAGRFELEERYALGERVRMVESLELGTVEGGEDCDSLRFVPIAAPRRFRGLAEYAYRVRLDAAGRRLVQRLGDELSGPALEVAGERLACNTYAERASDGTRDLAEMVVRVRLEGGAAFPPGEYEVRLFVNGAKQPERAERFRVE